ncbi:TPA: hypothetical protein U2Q23_005350 [Burkholderia multivorans]|uniref:hypothetical protein n=1 Tax=Burkholderia multivorans TaxID=87883 RepID=UPI001C222208|nr:hypothetical protein [Burkholderia multivorans]MBU9649390.1 hypothetical protein [Burkholderia multivorans]MDN7476170.1 hypothetical protein [Burkholderia multivorans]HEM7842615.1 hypothetical protein [Burkholderia multivorans]HEM7872406.1 hypothetical protein [Burkholderia multivorans]HEM7908067.1 hypothetical protein [Burkholderia multivorans]
MKATVLGYAKHCDAHKCRFEDGAEKYIDLMVSGDLDNETHESLIGKTVEFESATAFILIAHRVRVVEEA